MIKKLIRFDWAVKRLLRNNRNADRANFVVLEGFLSELLFDNIRIERILESEGNQESDDDKFNRVDILTQNSKNELILVEIQNTYEIDYFHRMNYGVSKAVSESISLGNSYSEIKKVISINIVYFDLGKGKDYIYKGGVQFEGIHKKDVLQLSDRQKETFHKDNVSDIFPEYYIIKVNKFNDKAKDTLDEWVYFFKNSEVKDDFKAKGLKEAQEILDIMRLTKEQQYGYNRHLDSLHLKASEIFSMKEEAEYNVRVDEKIGIAKIAISEGVDDKIIAKITGLETKKIKELRKELGVK